MANGRSDTGSSADGISSWSSRRRCSPRCRGSEYGSHSGVDGSAEGLKLLEITTAFSAEKIARETQAFFARDLPTPWATLRGIAVHGYEIRHGSSRINGKVLEALPSGLGFASGSVLGVYLHGLFESPNVVAALSARLRRHHLRRPSATWRTSLMPRSPPIFSTVLRDSSEHRRPRVGRRDTHGPRGFSLIETGARGTESLVA